MRAITRLMVATLCDVGVKRWKCRKYRVLCNLFLAFQEREAIFPSPRYHVVDNFYALEDHTLCVFRNRYLFWAGLSIFPATMPLQGFPAVEYDSNYDEADAPMDQKRKRCVLFSEHTDLNSSSRLAWIMSLMSRKVGLKLMCNAGKVWGTPSLPTI
jgi:hypothetical protein